MKEKEKMPVHPERRKLDIILLSLTVLTVLNLLFTASMVGLVAGIVILVMVWGVRKGDWPLTKGLSVFLLVYGGVNLAVLAVTVFFGAEARVSAMIWLLIYSVLLIVSGVLLRHEKLQEYLKTAPQPEEKQKKITLFKGGWRDL